MNNPTYIGLKHKRVRGQRYDELIDEFLQAVTRRSVDLVYFMTCSGRDCACVYHMTNFHGCLCYSRRLLRYAHSHAARQPRAEKCVCECGCAVNCVDTVEELCVDSEVCGCV